MKILFAKAHMLCHDINSFTKAPSHIDVIMGASTGGSRPTPKNTSESTKM